MMDWVRMNLPEWKIILKDKFENLNNSLDIFWHDCYEDDIVTDILLEDIEVLEDYVNSFRRVVRRMREDERNYRAFLETQKSKEN